MSGHGGTVIVLVWVMPPGPVIVVVMGFKSMLYVGLKGPVGRPSVTLTLENGIEFVVMAGIVTVMVAVVPGLSSKDVV
jgi:hypothetical protein